MASIEHTDRFDVQMSPAGKAALAALIQSELCPALDESLDLSPGTATPAKVLQYLVGNVDFHPNEDGSVSVGCQLRLPAQVIVDMP